MEVGRKAVIAGMVAVTQHVRIGEFAFVAARSGVNKDILPYTVAEGRWATSRAVNKVGLQRAGVSPGALRSIRRAIRRLAEFAANSPRGLARGHGTAGA